MFPCPILSKLPKINQNCLHLYSISVNSLGKLHQQISVSSIGYSAPANLNMFYTRHSNEKSVNEVRGIMLSNSCDIVSNRSEDLKDIVPFGRVGIDVRTSSVGENTVFVAG